MQTTIKSNNFILSTVLARTLALVLAATLTVSAISTPVQAQLTGGKRQTGTTPPKPNQPDDIKQPVVDINFEQVAQKIYRALQGKAVGFSFAIFHNQKLQKYGQGGYARRTPDTVAGKQVPFLKDMRIGIASSTKTITAIAVLKALESRGKDDSELIYKYLPTNWKIHPSVKTLTFKDILSHHSGLKKITDGSYDGLRLTIETGVDPNYQVEDYSQQDDDYQNINFVLCRVLLPYIVAAKEMKSFEGDAKKAAEMAGKTSLQFARDYVFKPAGVSTQIQFQPWDESGKLDNVPLYYNFADPLLAGRAPALKDAADNSIGAGGLYVSAVELAQIISALENGKLLSFKTRLMMKEHDLGIFQWNDSAYWTHNGGDKDSKGRGVSTRLVLCPYNVQVAILINSAKNTTANTFHMVREALEDSIIKP